jgi:hypothetical protein
MRIEECGGCGVFFPAERPQESVLKAYARSTFGYRLFHLAVLGLAGVLPPKTFYKLRGWYSERGLAHVRQVVGSAMPVPSLSLRKAEDL